MGDDLASDPELSALSFAEVSHFYTCVRNGQRMGNRLSELGFNQLVPPPGHGEPQ